MKTSQPQFSRPSRPHPLALLSFLFLLLASNSTLSRQNLLPQLKFDHIAQSKLEPLGHINDIIQDADGYMWFAAAKGVARYDGYQLKIFRHDGQADSLPDHWVSQLLITSNNVLWALTRVGPCLYNPITVQFRCLGDTQRDEERTYLRLFEDSQQRLWISSYKGLFHVNTKDLNMTEVPLNNEQGPVTYIAEDAEGNIWLGHNDKGITVLSPQLKLIKYLSEEQQTLPGNKIRALTFDRQGRLWIGIQDQGVAVLEKGAASAQLFAHDTDEKSREVWDITQDTRGLIWIGDGTGAHVVNPDDMSVENHRYIEGKPKTPGNYVVRSIYADNTGGVWLGYFPSGIDRVDQQASQFISYRHDPGYSGSLPDGGVLSTLETSDGSIWVGAGFGLAKFNRRYNNFTRFVHDKNDPSGLSGSTILDIEEGNNGELWFGAWDKGLNRRDPTTGEFRHYLPEPGNPNSLLGREPWGLLFDSEQRLWVATEKGISRYRPATDDFQRYLPIDEDGQLLDSLYTRSIYEDKQGNIWVSSFAGLQKLNPETGRFKPYVHDAGNPQSISSNAVLLTYEDSKNRFWVATDGSGLNLFDRESETFTRFGKESGLPDLSITNILEGNNGDLWLSTYHGIVRFSPERGVIRHYTRVQGLPGNLYNRRSGNQLRSGELIIGSSEGLVIFNPQQLQHQNQEFNTVFSELRVMNKVVNINDATGILTKDPNHAGKITLNHQQNIFSLDFAGLDFSAPEETRYRYRLIGFDNGWQEINNDRSVTYTNLDAGAYTLEINSGKKGHWNQSTSTLAIEILPPPWLTWWAKLLYSILFLGLLGAIYAAQRARLIRADEQLKQEQELVSKLRDVEKLKDNINRELDQKVELRTLELEKEKARLQAAHTQLEELNEKLASLTITDQLTGLYNRRYLEQTVEKDIAMIHRKLTSGSNNASLTFVLFDMDNFKSVNDTYGHNAGDQVLIRLAQLLQDVVRDSDYVVRWGGEEFMIVMRDQSDSDAKRFAERLRTAISQTPFPVNDKLSLEKTVSIGIARYPFEPEFPTAMHWEHTVGLADRALYKAKHTGKDRWVSLDNNCQNWTATALQKLNNESDFDHAIQQGLITFTSNTAEQP